MPTATATTDLTQALVGRPIPSCRICGHEDYYLGDHLAEAHDMSIDEYLKAYPGAPTVAQELLDVFDSEREKNVRRSHPPTESDLRIEIRGFPVPVNADVPARSCLPLPDVYRFPEHGDLAIDIIEVMIGMFRGRSVYIHGMPGTGKDALVHALCALTRRPSIIKQVQPAADIQAWFYSRSFDKDGTSWEEGELLKALRDGYVSPISGRTIPYLILITDFDRATTAQAESLRLVLDSIAGRVEGPHGVVDVLPGTQIIVTANTAGGGDTRGRCISANVIDASLLDRFERKYEFHWMEWADEGPICKAKFPLLAQRCPDLFDQVGKATASLRDAIGKEQLYAEFSHRAVCAWLGHAEDIIAVTGDVPNNLARRAARAFLDGMPDSETRLQAERLIDPHIRGGVVGTPTSDASSDPLGGFGV